MAITPSTLHARGRQVEGEGILRLLLLAAAFAMPLASMIYIQVQNTRMSYAMNEVRDRIKVAEENQRKLLLERSRFQRDEEVSGYAIKAGLQPRKTSHLIHRSFTADDQKLAKLHPVSSDRL